MKQKIFLTSALAMGFVAPAFAEMTDSNTFPNASQGEYMQENTRYIGAATADNMDTVYEGNVNAIAEYTEIPYSAAEGFYLTGVDNNNNAITAECTSGNFCPGVASTTYENNAFVDTGLQSCSTATSGAYTLSDAGASSSGQCYRTCDGNVSILHATGVTGNDYSDGTNTCKPTGCDNGWHVQPSVPDLTTVIGRDSRGVTHGYGYNGVNGTPLDYGITEWDNKVWAIDYGSAGAIKIRGICSAQQGINNWDGNATTSSNVTEGGGYNCWCKIESYTPNMGTEQAISAPWMFAIDLGGEYYCSRCAQNCSAYISVNDDNRWQNFRIGFLGSVTPRSATCEANVININWYNADSEDISANNAGTATYGSDVRTPVKAQTIKGKTFRGWRFSKPETTNLPE